MSYSYVQYTGNGTLANYTFPFQYLSADHIQVKVNGVPAIYSLLNANTVTITPTPALNSIVEIRRVTPRTPTLLTSRMARYSSKGTWTFWLRSASTSLRKLPMLWKIQLVLTLWGAGMAKENALVISPRHKPRMKSSSKVLWTMSTLQSP